MVQARLALKRFEKMKKQKKKILQAITILVLLLAVLLIGSTVVFLLPAKTAEDLQRLENPSATGLTEEQKALLTEIFETETAYLASVQLANGAIPMTGEQNGEVTMNPYFSSVAALALLDNADKYAQNVKAYAEWYFAHLNTADTDYNGVDGTIYDYIITLENGKIIKEAAKGSYDSTDSYAATFLTVLNKYYEKTGDADYILSRAADIDRVADALLSTFSFGLTHAKPDYEVKYLMDNCEVYEGMKAGMSLLTLINDTSIDGMLRLTKYKMGNEVVAQAIEKSLWNAKENHYEAGIFAMGAAINDFKWSEFYPCATAQLFPITCGVIAADTQRASKLYDRFCEEYDWQNHNIPDAFCWGNNALAAAMVGDVEAVMTYMQCYAPKMLTHAYPLYNADIARVAMAANVLLNK